ncbi:porin [Shewanella sp. JM162201]|uniref:Porin n=1 Tax=Shewanella jiangmenensis TaxID=2837387 RepID=A0ABS5VBZ2_9GAMM|nr:porin [Shewanella jiangmenensis]MBT1446563.1 porin [Shewanella jiangmenensis]
MKKTLIAMATLLPAFSSMAAADFYGRINLSVTDSELGVAAQNGKAGTVLENNSSRIGFKGGEELSPGLKLFYQLEFGVDNFDNSGKTFKPRNSFLGVKTDFGALSVGRNDTVFKTAEGKVDIFGTTNSDIDRLLPGQTRAGDSLTYQSPKLADLITVNGTYLMSDNYDGDNAYALSTTLGDSGLKNQPWYVALAYNKGIDGVDAARLVSQVKLGEVTLGGLLQQSEHQDAKYAALDGDTWFVNLAWDIGKTRLKFEYGHDDAGLGKYVSRFIKAETSGSLADVSNVDLNQLSVGANYKVSKTTQLWGHYTRFDGDLLLAGTSVELDDDLITLGVRYDF